eukprot:scpid110583/ scgid27527/ 
MLAAKAKLYDENSAFQFRQGMILMDDHLMPEEGDRILDPGCGTGGLAGRLACCVGCEGEVVAVDPNVERLHVARDNIQPHHNNIKIVAGAIDDALGMGPCDGIFCNFVLKWVQDGNISHTLHRVLGCLKPGKAMCANIGVHSGPLFSDLELLLTGKATPETAPRTPGQAAEYMTQLCESIGFNVVVSEEVKLALIQSGLDSCIAIVRAYTEVSVEERYITDEEIS